MKLPPASDIAMGKLTRYLLVPLAKSDKAHWLARGRHTAKNPDRLQDDLRGQILPLNATLTRSTPFGEAYQICGHLHGPSGNLISIRTIWLKQAIVRTIPSCNVDSTAKSVENEKKSIQRRTNHRDPEGGPSQNSG